MMSTKTRSGGICASNCNASNCNFHNCSIHHLFEFRFLTSWKIERKSSFLEILKHFYKKKERKETRKNQEKINFNSIFHSPPHHFFHLHQFHHCLFQLSASWCSNRRCRNRCSEVGPWSTTTLFHHCRIIHLQSELFLAFGLNNAILYRLLLQIPVWEILRYHPDYVPSILKMTLN